MAGILDITICIPTYNRADVLDETLRRLYDSPVKFKKILVSDNCSGDHTPDILVKYKSRYPNFDCSRNPENIGAILNFQKLLTSTDTQYQYLLSDDDVLYHDSILAAVEFLDENPEFAAVYGDYDYEVDLYHRDLDVGQTAEDIQKTHRTISYFNNSTIIDRDSLIDHIGNIPMIHPVYRVEAFRRHCFFDRFSFGFFRVLGQLVKYGPLLYMPVALFSHEATEDRLEKQIHTSWYYDHALADFETMLSDIDPAQPLSDGEKAQMVSRFMRAHYEFALRDALYHRRDPMLSRHYLQRLKGGGGQTEPMRTLWTEKMLLPAIARMIADRIGYGDAATVIVSDRIPDGAALSGLLRDMLPGRQITAGSAVPSGPVFVVAQDEGDPLLSAAPAAGSALFEHIRAMLAL